MLDATEFSSSVDLMGSVELAKALSPSLHLHKHTPPTILFFGTEDRFTGQAKVYLRDARRIGANVTLYTADGVGHGFFNNEPWRDKTLYLADQFLSSHGYLQGSPTLSIPEGVEMLEVKSDETSN